MIVICGPTGSGKSTTIRALSELGYEIIHTYTTRPQRPDDDYGTICIDPDKFKNMLLSGDFLAYSTYQASFGQCSYGIRYDDMQYPTANRVIIGAIEYIENFKRQLINNNEIGQLFQVYLDVADETIIKMAQQNTMNGRKGNANNDVIKRLNRDHVKNLELKKTSNLVIPNLDMGLSVEKVVSTIVEEYNRLLKRKGGDLYGKTDAGDYIRQNRRPSSDN